MTGKDTNREERIHDEQNDIFYYIAGYTSGGAPYGVTWEEMGLQPYETPNDEIQKMEVSMKKLNLSEVAGELDMVSSDTRVFYNTETGEFDFYNDGYMVLEEDDAEKFEDAAWIALPDQHEIREYDIMEDFAERVTDPHKSEMLSIALEGRGAFRRFKDTLSRVNLEDDWYAFKHKAFMRIAREWCERNGIEYTDDTGDSEPEPARQSDQDTYGNSDEKVVVQIAVTMETLESHNHIIGDIERGVKVYKSGGVELAIQDSGMYWAHVPHKHGSKAVTVVFTKNGRDIKAHSCQCTWSYRNPPVCRHVVAAVLAIQGRIIESGLKLGKTATVSTVVNETNTARAVQSGSLDVFSTPMMIGLMEQAACECLVNALEPGQTSVGTEINVSHTAASPPGMEITAAATIESVLDNKVVFAVTASDSFGEIGKGKHTRVIVNREKFLKKTETRMNTHVSG